MRKTWAQLWRKTPVLRAELKEERVRGQLSRRDSESKPAQAHGILTVIVRPLTATLLAMVRGWAHNPESQMPR
jgi:hypothetical protein